MLRLGSGGKAELWHEGFTVWIVKDAAGCWVPDNNNNNNNYNNHT